MSRHLAELGLRKEGEGEKRGPLASILLDLGVDDWKQRWNTCFMSSFATGVAENVCDRHGS